MIGEWYESRSSSFRDVRQGLQDLCIRHSKSDPVLVTLSRSSLVRNSDQDCWDSIEDLQQHLPLQAAADVVTLEGLKSHYNSCFTCGVSWYEDHASLDCAECGGYALNRPCLHCNGSCDEVWSRDLAASHKLRRAQWQGECKKAPPQDAAAPKSQDS
ncbi:protein pinocchio-like isoform X3 [Haemaphysalis longicornis]